MTIKRVFLAGEGRNEVGGWGGHPAYQTSGSPGVIEALLQKTSREGWEVVGAIEWRRIRKIRVGPPRPADHQNVLGAALHAREAGCSVLAFTRDRDNDASRENVIEAAIQEASASVKVIGGVAKPVLEGWILAMRGTHRTEALSPEGVQRRLQEAGVTSTEAMVRVIAETDLAVLPSSAVSLRVWLQRADVGLC